MKKFDNILLKCHQQIKIYVMIFKTGEDQVNTSWTAFHIRQLFQYVEHFGKRWLFLSQTFYNGKNSDSIRMLYKRALKYYEVILSLSNQVVNGEQVRTDRLISLYIVMIKFKIEQHYVS